MEADQLEQLPQTPPIPNVSGKEKVEIKRLFPHAERLKMEKETVMHNAFKWIVRVALVCFLAVFIIRVAHFVLPSCWRWLNDHDIQGLDKLIFSGAIGGFIGKFYNDNKPGGQTNI